jgi:hypothetical protein
VGVSGYPASELVCLLDNRLQFLDRVLRRPGLVSFAEHPPGRHDLDDVSSVLHDFSDLRARHPRTIGNAALSPSKLRRQQIIVGVPARDAERGTGHQHARSLDLPGTDSIANRDISESTSVQVAHRREAGL